MTPQLEAALDLMRRKALAKYPTEATRIDCGYSIALTGGVELLADGTAMVASQTFDETRYAVAKGVCPCNDATYRPQGPFCKHRMARQLMMNAMRMIKSPTWEQRTTRKGTSYYTHTNHDNVTILLGERTLADAQRRADGNLVRKAAGYAQQAV